MADIAPVLAQAKVKMNVATSVMLGIVKAMQSPIVMILFLAAVAAGIVYLRRWLATPDGAALRDQYVMRVPLIGELIRKIETTRICESLSTLYGSGLPLMQCIEVATEACNNAVGRQALKTVANEVKLGEPIWKAMSKSSFFSRSVVQMINVGEESGTLEKMLGKIAQYNDLEVRTALEQFAAAIEPMMIVGLGIVVTIIVLVAFAPLYQLIWALG
jgi:type IV pilus assembly protein PilC